MKRKRKITRTVAVAAKYIQNNAQKDVAELFLRSPAESVLKTEIFSLTEHLQRNPTYEKGQGRSFPARGKPLANLTTVSKVKPKENPESLGRTCVESVLRKVHPEFYIPPLTQPIKNAPNLYHFKRLVILG